MTLVLTADDLALYAHGGSFPVKPFDQPIASDRPAWSRRLLLNFQLSAGQLRRFSRRSLDPDYLLAVLSQ